MNTTIAALMEALETAQNGLQWYRDAYPDADSGADDEMHEQIDAALTLARAEQAEIADPDATVLADETHDFSKVHDCLARQLGTTTPPTPLATLEQIYHKDACGIFDARNTCTCTAPTAPVQAVEPLTAWQPRFEAMSHKQETLAVEFCAEIAGPRGQPGNPPDPVRLLEMAQALYEAERDDFAAAPPLPKG